MADEKLNYVRVGAALFIADASGIIVGVTSASAPAPRFTPGAFTTIGPDDALRLYGWLREACGQPETALERRLSRVVEYLTEALRGEAGFDDSIVVLEEALKVARGEDER